MNSLILDAYDVHAGWQTLEDHPWSDLYFWLDANRSVVCLVAEGSRGPDWTADDVRAVARELLALADRITA